MRALGHRLPNGFFCGFRGVDHKIAIYNLENLWQTFHTFPGLLASAVVKFDFHLYHPPLNTVTVYGHAAFPRRAVTIETILTTSSSARNTMAL